MNEFEILPWQEGGIDTGIGGTSNNQTGEVSPSKTHYQSNPNY